VTLKSSRPPAGGLALNYDKITGSAKPSISLLKENKMIDIIIDISKIGIRSIFTAKKYDTQILDEDLRRILFIRNYIEESLLFVKETYEEVDAKVYFNELKKYALELFVKQCEVAISDEERNSEDFSFENHKEEDAKFFNYIYDNLKYPE